MCSAIAMVAAPFAGSEAASQRWHEHDLALAEGLDAYWDRLTELAGELHADTAPQIKGCYPFSEVREVTQSGLDERHGSRSPFGH